MQELFADFPFTSEGDKTHALACLFQPFIRKFIFGPTPLFLLSASLPSSGKSLLVRIICTIVMGEEISARVLSGSEEERRKMILAELIRGRPIIFLDNLDDDLGNSLGYGETCKLHSPALASVLTSTFWTDRLLGKSQMIQTSNEALWVLTGNNPQLSLEIQRRCLLIRLEPDCDKPWQRDPSKFRHSNIIEWTKKNRARLIETVLTAVISWIAAGSPIYPGQSLGSFEQWSEIMRSILAFLGLNEFLTNQDQLEQTLDPVSEIWSQLVERWHKNHGNEPIHTSEILNLSFDGLLTPIIGSKDTLSQQVALGKQLSRKQGCVIGDCKITITGGGAKRGNRYALIPVCRDGGSGEVGGDFANAEQASFLN